MENDAKEQSGAQDAPSEALREIQKKYVLVGQSKIRPWQTWLVLGLVAGIGVSVFYTANKSGRFSKSSAEVRLNDIQARKNTPIDRMLGVAVAPDKTSAATILPAPNNAASQVVLAGKSGQDPVILGTGRGSKAVALPKSVLDSYAPVSFNGFIVAAKSPPLAETASQYVERFNAIRAELSRAKDRTTQLALRKQLSDLEAERKGKLLQAKESLQMQQQSARAELQSLASSIRVKETYTNAFSGFFAEMTPQDAETLKSAGYEVWPNGKVQAVLNDSVPLINADDVWNLKDAAGNPITGKGIKIAIVDTGIDYTHPDLGGCLGASCKVAGGYDVVNRDNDPMDDMGHGTHVAAIAAGNGSLKGVAPDATLYAYKVLNSGGSGTFADVIEGIERAVDPNLDGDFSDGADVINISLGGWGDPDDPAAKTVDSAVKAGVVVAVAAGNSGPSWAAPYGTILTPGVARDAITVAATDKSDMVAWFSSRGPVYWKNQTMMKPDIAAPGVAICAAEWDGWLSDLRCQDDKHIAISGTSMATPHVTGLVALMLQAHPELVPAQVKSALKTGAKEINGSVTERGSGRVDALNSANMTSPPVATLYPISTKGKNKVISGKITSKSLKEWSLSYALITHGNSESNWKDLLRSTKLPQSTRLYDFDSNKVQDGAYAVRILAEDKSGQRSVDYGYLYVDKLQLLFPQDGDMYRPGDTITVKYFLEGLSAGLLKFRYVDTGGNTVPIPNGVWKTDGLTTGWYALQASITHDGVEDVDSVNVYFDSTLKKGWPQRLGWDKCPKEYGECMVWGGMYEAVVSDLEKDGKKEILVFRGGTPPKIFIYRSDGSLRASFPVGNMVVAGGNLHIPLVEDIDGDGKKEIFAYNPNLAPPYPGYSSLYAFRSTGQLLPGWPIKIPQDYHPAMAAADLDGDGKSEIIVQGRGYPQQILILSGTGKMISRWDIGTTNWAASIDSTPAVGNFDNDKDLEIVAVKPSPNAGGKFDENGNFLGWVNEGEVYVFNKDGTQVPGWPVLLPGEPFGSPAVGDLDGDGDNEIAVGLLYASDIFPDMRYGGLYVFDGKGNMLPGWPVNVGYNYWSSPSLSDLDGDGDLEIASSRLGFFTEAYHHNGQLVSGWPQVTSWNDYYSTIVGDITGDKIPELLTTAGNVQYGGGGVYSWSANGQSISGFPKGTEIDAQAPPVIDDLDGDGKLEVIASSDFDMDTQKFVFKNRGSLYVWQLESPPAPDTMHWPTFHHDVQRTGLYAPLGPVNPPKKVSLQILSPNGGEKWIKGTKETILWKSENLPDSALLTFTLRHFEEKIGDYVDIPFLTDTPNDGSEKITVPVEIADDMEYKLQIKAVVGNSVVDDWSDGAFSIQEPLITVLSPNGGEEWTIGSNQTIHWKLRRNIATDEMQAIDAYRKSAPDVTYRIWNSALGSNETSFVWNVGQPNEKMFPPADDYVMRIYVVRNAGPLVAQDDSDSPFKILPKVESNGSLSVRMDPSTPSRKIAAAGATGVLLGVLSFEASNETIALSQVALQLGGSKNPADIEKVTLWDGANKVGEALFGPTPFAVAKIIGDVIVPKDDKKLIIIRADLAQIGNGLSGTAGDSVSVNFDGEGDSYGVGQNSGRKIPASGKDTDIPGVIMFKSYPQVAKIAVPSNVLNNGDITLYRFKVTSSQFGSVGLAKFTVKIGTLGSAKVSDLKIFGYTDSSFTQAAYDSNPLNSAPVQLKSDGAADIYFNPNALAGPEPIQIPGSVNFPVTRYFELVGTTASAANGDMVTVQLEGDDAGAGVAAFAHINGAPDNDFIWSGNSTSTTGSALGVSDWANGYLAPGLPSSNLSPEVFVR